MSMKDLGSGDKSSQADFQSSSAAVGKPREFKGTYDRSKARGASAELSGIVRTQNSGAEPSEP